MYPSAIFSHIASPDCPDQLKFDKLYPLKRGESDVLQYMNVFRAVGEKVTPEDLAQRMIERRLTRRVIALKGGPEVEAWVESAITRWKMARAGDVVSELRQRPDFSDYPHYPKRIPLKEQDAIREWARSWCARSTGTPLSSKVLKADRDEIVAASRSMRAQYLKEHEIDVAFASVHAEYPWLEKLTTKAWRQCLRRARSGRPAGVGPLLISGPPGVGKSSWSRAVSRALGVPSVGVDVGATGGTHDLQGVPKGWSSSDRGRVTGVMISQRIGNPLICIDELDAGSSRVGTSSSGSLPGIYKVLMSMIEPSTARAWSCPHLQIDFNLSEISWIATCSDERHIDQPLLDRMTVIKLDDMTRDQLMAFAAREAADRFGSDFSDIMVEQVRDRMRRGGRLSLRHVVRLLDRVEEALERPILH